MKNLKLFLITFIGSVLLMGSSCSGSKPAASGNEKKPKAVTTRSVTTKNIEYVAAVDEQVSSTYQAVDVKDDGVNPATIKGLHLCTKWRGTLDPEALKNPDVTSVTLFAYWSDLNPSKGNYDWSRLDGELNRFVAAGKNVGLSIAAGAKSPAWIYNEGVRHFTVVEFQHNGKGKRVENDQAVVYDKAYIELYTKFLTDLSAHMKQQKYWSKLILIAGHGINQVSAELRLAAQSEMEQGGEKGTDAVALWKANDYDPLKVIDAFKQIVTVLATSFPNRYIIIPVFNSQNVAFPKIGTAKVAPECMTWIKKTYPNRVAAKYTVLNPDYVPKGFIKELMDMDIPVGYQLSQITVEDTNDDNTFQKSVQAGINANALFIEVFPANAKKFQSSIKKLSPNVQRRQ